MATGDREGKAEARVYSLILAAQNVLSALPNEKRIAEFVKEALHMLPGVKSAWVCLRSLSVLVGDGERKECRACIERGVLPGEGTRWRCDFEERDGFESFLLETGTQNYGVIVIEVGDAGPLARYQSALVNFVNSVAITLENRRQQESLREHALEVEGINDDLRHEIAARQSAEEELRRTHEQLLHSAKLSALGKLTGAIAHEFNNPLQGMRSILESLKDELKNEEMKNLLLLAVKECDRMATLVARLREFYVPSSGELITVDFHDLLDEVTLFMKKRLQQRDIKLTVLQVDQPLPVKCVPDQIKQVLINVIQNADESISHDKGLITIETRTINSQLFLEIKDNGSGIKPENIPHVFEPFFTTKSSAKGTGLGLSVCYGIIKKHNGELTIKNNEHSGTCLTISMPLSDQHRHHEK